MSIFKNRTVIGVICILLALVICFGITPLFNQSISQKAEIVRVTKDIHAGELITKDMVTTTEVGSYNLPSGLMTAKDNVVGKYAKADLAVGDYILAAKLSDAPAAENAYLYNLDGTKQAISVTIKSFATGLSGKLQSGDIVSVIVADYMNRLDQLSRDELIQAADEISAMMTCHSELMAFGENLSRKKMIFLLQQEKPLELLSEAWMEHQTVDVGETFQSLLTGLYDETRQTQVRDMVYAIQPKTIEELLTSYPDDYFQLMTPCGFVDLTPSETEKLLHGEATMAHPGVSGCQMPVEAQELLEMEVLSLKRDEHGCWYALTDHPQQKMEQAPQEPQML